MRLIRSACTAIVGAALVGVVAWHVLVWQMGEVTKAEGGVLKRGYGRFR